MLQTLSIRITGKVQGVWFRKHTQEKACELGITGTIENITDGSVLIVATGTEIQLQLFTNWCKTGPSKAKVETITIEELPFLPFSLFEIKRS
jgi:acylphosphatase